MNHQNKFLLNVDEDCQAIPPIPNKNDTELLSFSSPSNYWDDNTDEYKDDPLSNALQSICLMQIMRDGRC